MAITCAGPADACADRFSQCHFTFWWGIYLLNATISARWTEFSPMFLMTSSGLSTLATFIFSLEGEEIVETVGSWKDNKLVLKRRTFWNPQHRKLCVNIMDNAGVFLFFFFWEEKEIPFLLCNQEIEDVYLQITNCLWCGVSWKLSRRMFSYCLFWCFCHFTLTFFCSL